MSDIVDQYDRIMEGRRTVPIHGEFHLLFVVWDWSMDFFQL